MVFAYQEQSPVGVFLSNWIINNYDPTDTYSETRPLQHISPRNLAPFENSTRTLESTAALFCKSVGLSLAPLTGPTDRASDSANYYDYAIELYQLISVGIKVADENKAFLTDSYVAFIANADYTLFRITGSQSHPDDGKTGHCLKQFQLPFLCHWSCVVHSAVSAEQASDLSRVRRTICALLLGNQAKKLSTKSPREVALSLSKGNLGLLPSMRPFYRAIESLDKADPIPSNPESRSGSSSQSPHPSSAPLSPRNRTLHPRGKQPHSRKQSRLQQLSNGTSKIDIEEVKVLVASSPSQAAWDLSHLAVNLSTTELMLQLAEHRMRFFLETYGIDVYQVTRDFIHHALRELEGVQDQDRERERERESSRSVEFDPNVPNQAAYSKDLSTVAYTVSLLALLIRSVVSRNLIPEKELLWEARELIYRFPWVPEVPALRGMFNRTPDLSGSEASQVKSNFIVGG